MTGKAAVFTEVNQPFQFREYPLPDVAPDAMLIRVTMANICGSDLHFVRGGGPGLKGGTPRILGHEMVGVIARLGRAVKSDTLGQPLREGDRVCYAYYLPCGACPACWHGVPGCPNRYRYWLEASCEDPPHFHGAYGEFYYLRPGQWVYRLPDTLQDRVVSPVNCALAQMVYGLHRVGVTLGDAVAIQGAGGLGLYACAIAREMGAGTILVLDLLPDRLELAKSFGADATLNVTGLTAQERAAAIRERTGGHGADLVVEVSGSPAVLEEGIAMARVGGRILWIGNINLGRTGTVDPGQVVRGSRTIMGLVVYEPWVIPRALGFLQRAGSRYPFDRIISHTFPLSAINEAFAVAAERKALRVSLLPGA